MGKFSNAPPIAAKCIETVSCLFLLMAWKNIEEACLVLPGRCAQLCVSGWFSLSKPTRISSCVTVQCLYSGSPAPCLVVLPYKHIGTKQHPQLPRISVPSPLYSSFPLVWNLSPMYEAFLCGCVTWIEANREGELASLGLTSYCALMFLSPLHSCGQPPYRRPPQLSLSCVAYLNLSCVL